MFWVRYLEKYVGVQISWMQYLLDYLFFRIMKSSKILRFFVFLFFLEVVYEVVQLQEGEGKGFNEIFVESLIRYVCDFMS